MVLFKHIIASVAVGCAFCFILILLTLLNTPFGLTSLEYQQNTWSIAAPGNESSIQISFISPDNNLGIIILPFVKKNLLPETPVEFILSDSKTNQLIYKNTYVKKNFSDSPFFPFGIPIQPNSSNNTYLITLLFQNNLNDTPISMALEKPITTVHVYRGKLLSSEGMHLIVKKIANVYNQIPWSSYLIILLISIAMPYLLLAINPNINNKRIAPIYLYTIYTAQLSLCAIILLLPQSVSSVIYLLWFLCQIILAKASGYSALSGYFVSIFMFFMCFLFLLVFYLEIAHRLSVMGFFFVLYSLSMDYYKYLRGTILKIT